MPRANPRNRCDQRVNRLLYEYRSITASATGESISVRRFNWEAARTKIPHETRTNALTNDSVNCPTGRARVAVRGLAASIEASARRLKAIAAERAETIATTIHPSCRHAGRPPAASMAPQSANGSAKIECSHLIISSVIFRFRRKPTRHCKAVVSDQWRAGRPRPTGRARRPSLHRMTHHAVMVLTTDDASEPLLDAPCRNASDKKLRRAPCAASQAQVDATGITQPIANTVA